MCDWAVENITTHLTEFLSVVILQVTVQYTPRLETVIKQQEMGCQLGAKSQINYAKTHFTTPLHISNKIPSSTKNHTYLQSKQKIQWNRDSGEHFVEAPRFPFLFSTNGIFSFTSSSDDGKKNLGFFFLSFSPFLLLCSVSVISRRVKLLWLNVGGGGGGGGGGVVSQTCSVPCTASGLYICLHCSQYRRSCSSRMWRLYSCKFGNEVPQSSHLGRETK